MNKNIIVLCMVFLITTQGAYIRKSQKLSPLQQLQQIKEQGNKFSKNLISNLELHLSTGGKIDEIIGFVREAKIESQTNLNELKEEYSSEKGRLEGLLEEYEQTVSNLNTELISTSTHLGNIAEDLNVYELKITNVRSDIQKLNDRIQALNQARENDDIAYQRRKQRDENSIKVLLEIIPELEKLASTGSAFLQKSQHDIEFALQKLSPSKSIQMLIELSTQFDKSRLVEVIEKLTSIKEAVKASRDQDQQDEIKSRAKYTILLQDTEKAITIKGELLNNYNSNKNSLLAQQETAQTLFETIQSNIENTKNLQLTTQDALELTNTSYQRRIQDGQQTVEALASALQILTENEGSIQHQFQEQQNQETGTFY